MRRPWALDALVAGIAVWSFTVFTFVVGFADHDIAQGIGLIAFVIGLYLVWEGGSTLWRTRTLSRRDKPK